MEHNSLAALDAFAYQNELLRFLQQLPLGERQKMQLVRIDD